MSDKKIAVQDPNNSTQILYYTADVITANDFYPFGQIMPGRKFTQPSSKYRYGFNGKENDNEVKGEGNQQDYGMRIYDPRLGKFLSVDPITADYPWYTPYQFAGNTPIAAIDIDGLEPGVIPYYQGNESVNPWGSKEAQSMGLDIIPGVGTVKGIYEAGTGKDAVTGGKVQWWQRGLNLIPFVKPIRNLVKGFNKVENVIEVSTKTANNISNINKTINGVTDASTVINKAADQTATVSKVYKDSKLNALASQYGDDIAKVAAEAGKEGTNLLRTSLVGAKQGLSIAWQAHHLLPTELLGKSKILREAVRQGFDFNGVANGIALDLARHSGSHKNYTQMALELLESNFGQFRKTKNYKEIAEMTATQLKDKISSTAGKINDIK